VAAHRSECIAAPESAGQGSLPRASSSGPAYPIHSRFRRSRGRAESRFQIRRNRSHGFNRSRQLASDTSLASVRRTWAIAAVGGALFFATTDLAFNSLAVWLAQNDFIATSAIVNELFLRLFPLVLTGLAVGYLASPHGFSAAAVAGLIGSSASLAFRYYGTAGWSAPGSYNAAAMFGWVAGTAIACGVCGWAGERLRANAGARPHT
jgi:hypothetical protein